MPKKRTRITHGMSKTPTYQSWADMKTRCNLPSTKQYKDYGGRGIGYCKRWEHFENFLRDMGVAPPGLTLERINNEKGYSPSNCRWATTKEQHRNMRCNRFLTHNGRTMCVADWAEEIGCKPMSIITRLNRGYSIEESLETPLQTSRHWLTFSGRTKSIADWAKETGIPHSVIRNRLNKGWTVEKALTIVAKTRPKTGRAATITFRGETKPIIEWEKITGLSYSAIKWRLGSGWPIEKIFSTPASKRSVINPVCLSNRN